jgi:hypothetical protein
MKNGIVKRAARRIITFVTSTTIARNYHPYSERWHPHNALRQVALDETVEYIKLNMRDALIRKDAFQVLSLASERVSLDGLYMEFGVRTGSTINHIASLNPETTIYGFDSFEGLPEAWTGWTQDKGHFGGEDIPQVKTNVELVKGWFDDSLPAFLAEHSGDVALVHIDSDLYSSAKTVLTCLAPRIKASSIIVFNEYFNYPNWKEHEFKAFQEFCEEHSVEYEYFCWGMFEAGVRILSIRNLE